MKKGFRDEFDAMQGSRFLAKSQSLIAILFNVNSTWQWRHVISIYYIENGGNKYLINVFCHAN